MRIVKEKCRICQHGIIKIGKLENASFHEFRRGFCNQRWIIIHSTRQNTSLKSFGISPFTHRMHHGGIACAPTKHIWIFSQHGIDNGICLKSRRIIANFFDHIHFFGCQSCTIGRQRGISKRISLTAKRNFFCMWITTGKPIHASHIVKRMQFAWRNQIGRVRRQITWQKSCGQHPVAGHKISDRGKRISTQH